MVAQSATIAHVAPFAVFVGIMSLEHTFSLSPEVWLPIRFCATIFALLLFSRGYISFQPSVPSASIALGAAVFVIWVAPDILFGYRHSWLFENALTSRAVTTVSPAMQRNDLFLVLRVATSTLLVPVIEELFWRSWLMRYVMEADFLKIPLGTYARSAFWITAVLFALEHGPYWEVGLAAGILYNWWIIRTKNLADCILAHAVTNGILAVYVIAAGQWQYWL